MKLLVMKEVFCAVLFCLFVSFSACNQNPQVHNSGSAETSKTDTLISGDSTNLATQEDSISEKPIFKATGNEPFWGLSIDSSAIKFKSLLEGYETFTASYVEPIRAMDANVKMYQSQSEAGEIKVQVFQSSCTDDMSGKKTNYKTTIEIKRTADTEYKIFTGCGDYITDYLLYDIWVLREIAGKPAKQNLFGKEIPRIEINTTEKTFMAFTGNKDIHGKIYIEGNTIRFTTYKEPPGLNEVEKDFLEKLRTVTSFKLAENHLLLSGSGTVVFKFQKVD